MKECVKMTEERERERERERCLLAEPIRSSLKNINNIISLGGVFCESYLSIMLVSIILFS